MMRFFNTGSTNPLGVALSEFSIELEGGNYELEEPLRTWSDQDEVEIISMILRDLDIPFAEIDAQLKPAPPIGALLIFHLLESLEMLKNWQSVAQEEKLDYLMSQGLLLEVKAGMPGPSLIYLDLLKHQRFSELVKLSLVNEVILNLERHGHKFGMLCDLALKTALGLWISIVQSSSSLKTRLSSDLASYQARENECLSVSEVEKRSGRIDAYILHHLEPFIPKPEIEGSVSSSCSRNIP